MPICTITSRRGLLDSRTSIHPTAWKGCSRKSATSSNFHATPKIVHLRDAPSSILLQTQRHHAGQRSLTYTRITRATQRRQRVRWPKWEGRQLGKEVGKMAFTSQQPALGTASRSTRRCIRRCRRRKTGRPERRCIRRCRRRDND